MVRFYTEPSNVQGDHIFITPPESHHIVDVMRLGIGSEVTVFDGSGREYIGVISKVSPEKTVTITIRTRSSHDARQKTRVALAVGIPKRFLMEDVLWKTTELGVDRVFPLITARTVNRPSREKSEKMTQRWQKIATEAAKQSGRLTVPHIEAITGFDDFLAGHLAHFSLSLIATLNRKEKKPLWECVGAGADDVLMMIGPEGDFTPQEVDRAEKRGCAIVTLGPFTLKVATASIFAVALLQYELNLKRGNA